MAGRTAILTGATGLVGARLLEELVKGSMYSTIKVFTRRPLEIEHIKIVEKVVDVEKPASWAGELRGDDLFIAIGTTMRKARTIERYEQIDRDLVNGIASLALEKGVSRIAVVSSMGASPTSRNYYSRIKGEMEAGIMKLPFSRIVIGRPSLLLGRRSETRLFERIAQVLAPLFSAVMTGRMKRYRAIESGDVAIALIALMSEDSGSRVYDSAELQEAADIQKRRERQLNPPSALRNSDISSSTTL